MKTIKPQKTLVKKLKTNKSIELSDSFNEVLRLLRQQEVEKPQKKYKKRIQKKRISKP